MLVHRRSLYNALDAGAKASGGGGVIPVLRHALLSVEGDQLAVRTTNLEQSVVSRIPFTGNGFAGALPVREALAKLIHYMPDEEIRLTTDGNKLSVSADGSKSRAYKVNTLPVADFPAAPDTRNAKHSVTISPALFANALKRVLFAIPRENSRFQLMGARLEVSPGAFRLIATDGHRLAKCHVADPLVATRDTFDTLLVREGIELALTLLDEAPSATFMVGDAHWSLCAGGMTMTSRNLEGTFPDYGRVISRDPAVTLNIKVSDLWSALLRLSAIDPRDDSSRAVRFFAEPNGELRISIDNADFGSGFEVVETTISSGKVPSGGIEIGLNSWYVAQALRAVESETVSLALKDANSQAVLTDGDWLCVIMPMRLR